jgi:asparagine synthase (glutamine-hydrolysing)
MLRTLGPNEQIDTAVFGGFCPYWTNLDGRVLIADTAEEMIGALPVARRIIDPVAVAGLLLFNYMPGTRTLVQGIQRMPWRATLYGDGRLERHPPIPHASNPTDPQQAARRLRELLTEELYSVARKHQRVYLLQTGGLDSRITAGVMKTLEPQLNTEIICVTWGQPNSRDVHYARRIAEWYDWEFCHIPYDIELTWQNILRGATWGGAEVIGIHLHGMPWFADKRPDDLVIASSFGDSVGRAEFSSVHVTNLKLRRLVNERHLMHPSIIHTLLPQLSRDRATAWAGAEHEPDWARYELDMQENYMRRMIAHAMDYIRQYCTLHQAFTSEPVVRYMWSLNPAQRTDDIYFQLLADLDQRLYSLPWARTAVAPDGTVEPDKSLRKNYHEWDVWLRNDLRPRLRPLVFSPGLRDLRLFLTPAIYVAWRKFLHDPEGYLRHRMRETIVKLASIELSRRHFDLQPSPLPTHFRDTAAYLTIVATWKIQTRLKSEQQE